MAPDNTQRRTVCSYLTKHDVVDVHYLMVLISVGIL
jgi:hypothetical protein